MERAKREPACAFIGLDPNHAALIEPSRKAAGPAKKGGLPNARFMLGSAETLPGPLAGRGTSVSILFPWGSLLRAATLPEPAFVEAVRALCQPGAAIELLWSFDARDAAELERLGIAGHEAMSTVAGWRGSGFAVGSVEQLDAAGIKAYPTTWARKLSAGSGRVATRVRMRR